MGTHSNSLKIIKCRGIIINNDKLLVVKYSEEHDFYALPGGHLEGKENPIECIERELMEEFGIKAEVGSLLYICQFSDPGKSFMELLFEIKNGIDFKNLDENKIDKNEIIKILWARRDSNIKILPEKLSEDFKNGVLGEGDVQFIR